MNYCWYLKKIVTTIWRSQPHRSERYIDEKFAHTSSKCGKCARDFRSRSFLLNIKNSRKLDHFKKNYFLWLKNKSYTGNVFFTAIFEETSEKERTRPCRFLGALASDNPRAFSVTLVQLLRNCSSANLRGKVPWILPKLQSKSGAVFATAIFLFAVFATRGQMFVFHMIVLY